ncbi:putative polygalacturonase [Phytophthora cinnamomi]|nr:putative polygalacturonase [Phytophthora cinnamomi]
MGRSCSRVDSLTVSAGITLGLPKTGATIEFVSTSRFSTLEWEGPLVRVSGADLTVKGSGVLDGQGSWYWEQG